LGNTILDKVQKFQIAKKLNLTARGTRGDKRRGTLLLNPGANPAKTYIKSAYRNFNKYKQTRELKYFCSLFLLKFLNHFFTVGFTHTDFPYYMTRGTKNAGFPETDQVFFYLFWATFSNI